MMFDDLEAPHQFVHSRWFNDIRTLWEVRSHVQWRNPFRAFHLSHWFALVALLAWSALQGALMASWLGVAWLGVCGLMLFTLMRNSLGDIAMWDWWPIFLGSAVQLAEDREVEGYKWLVQHVPRHMWCRSGQRVGEEQPKQFIFMSARHAMMFKLIHGGT